MGGPHTLLIKPGGGYLSVINKLARMPRWQQIGAAAAMGLLLLLFLLWLYRCWGSILLVLAPFVTSMFLAYLLSPVVLFFEQRHISRPFAIAVIYLLFAMILFVAWILIVPQFMEELQKRPTTSRLSKAPCHYQSFPGQLQRFNLPDIPK